MVSTKGVDTTITRAFDKNIFNYQFPTILNSFKFFQMKNNISLSSIDLRELQYVLKFSTTNHNPFGRGWYFIGRNFRGYKFSRMQKPKINFRGYKFSRMTRKENFRGKNFRE